MDGALLISSTGGIIHYIVMDVCLSMFFVERHNGLMGHLPNLVVGIIGFPQLQDQKRAGLVNSR